MRKLPTLLAGLLFLVPTALRAEPLPADKVPEPLKPWVQWALDGHEDARCPGLSGRGKACFWPARLSLELEDSRGSFRQDWQAYRDGWAALPGDAKRWPQDVLVDGRPAAVVLREGAPRVRLQSGAHAVTGSFRWDSMPELIQIPAETGLVALAIRGNRVPFPNRDAEGRLWLQKAASKQAGEDRIEVVVHRRVIDEIPLMLVTDIVLKVSGKNRELLLGKALPPKFIPTELRGPLPARLERDGRLRVQVRPGEWRLELGARHEGPVAELALPAEAGAGPWDRDEVWVFDAQPNLRLASVEGPASVDPQQTELPPDWRHLPAYLLRPGDKMRLAERRRGDSDPAPDQLNLQRTWWLDFNGGGYSIRDQIGGALRRSWRLEMPEPTRLGRAAVGGADQFITTLEAKPGEPGKAGIEIGLGGIQVEADSRIDGARFSVPAVSWSHDFQQVKATLNLPPGWRLIHAMGVDDAAPTWVSRWTLLDIFIVLMLSLAAGRLWGRRWGWLAFATLALCYHESGAPRWVWVFLLAFEALARALPEGRLRTVSEKSRLALRIVLVLVCIPFLLAQFRVGLYPQLEHRRMSSGSFAMPGLAAFEMSAAQSAEEAADGFEEGEDAGEVRADISMRGGAGGKSAYSSLNMLARSKKAHRSPAPLAQMLNLYAPDPNSRVATGPGMPSWSWNAVSLTWRGPVKQAQKMRLLLIGPFANFFLTLGRAALLVLLVLLVLGMPVGAWLEGAAQKLQKIRSAALIVLALLACGPAAKAEMPTPEMLNDLRGRLLRPADCEPDCVSISRMRVELNADSLTARLEVAAGAQAALPLPGGTQQWTPASVLVDGNPAKGLLRSSEGLLYLPVGPGAHQVVITGPLPDRESVGIPLPLKPRRVEVQASGWTVEGVREDGLAEDNLQLTRVRGAQRGPSDILQGGALPPFVLIQRELRLGLSWQIDSAIERRTPLGAAIVLDVPLLPGESVTSPEFRVEKGRIKISMGPQVSRVHWTSVLAEAPALALKAPDVLQWTEVWRVNASPIWHVVPQGIPEVQANGVRVREWRPWPGEGVDLAISRPKGVPGQTMTVDRTDLTVSPGLRAADASMTLDYRSSLGGQHTLVLPEGAELQSLAVDGRPQPVRQEKEKVTIPILPGGHQVTLSWRQPGGMGLFYRAPKVGLGAASVNSNITVRAPVDRWLLGVWGPRLGPAVLFWSVLAVMLLLSVALGRLGLAPLSVRDWFLLLVGLSQVPIPVAALVAGWLLVLGVRKNHAIEDPLRFDSVQVALSVWTVSALVCLFIAIKQGLLGQPEMQIAGNDSSAGLLRWYLDRSGPDLPRPGVFSVPRMVYRLAMLGWALWIASSLLVWLRWGWGCLNEGGLWKQVQKPEKRKPAA